MANYTKLFNSIVTSTIWTEDDKTRIVWITMLAIADKNGEVQGSVPGLARIAAVSVDDCRTAIAKFLSPDPDSRTKDDEGRRIEEIDGGWALLNHQKYREMASIDERRYAEAQRKARYRDKLKRNEMSQNVRDRSREVPKKAHIAEADTKAEAKKDEDEEKNSSPPPKFPEVQKFAKSQPMPIADECIESFFDEMEALQWTYRGQPCVAKTAWQGRFRKWATNWINNANQPSRTR